MHTEDSQEIFEAMPRHVIYTSSEAAEDHEPPNFILQIVKDKIIMFAQFAYLYHYTGGCLR